MVTLKQEVNLSQNALLSLTQGFCHPDEVTQTWVTPFFQHLVCLVHVWLGGVCLSGWAAGIRHSRHVYPVLPRASEQGSKSLPSPAMLPDNTGICRGSEKPPITAHPCASNTAKVLSQGLGKDHWMAASVWEFSLDL